MSDVPAELAPQPLFPGGSPEAARHWATLLEALRIATPASRAKIRSRWMDESFDLPDLKKVLDRYRKASAVGRRAGWALLALLFVALPLSLYTPLGRFVRPAWCSQGAGPSSVLVRFL